ncbi:MAG: nitroreductase family protein [Bacteroidota bacterium]
MEFLELVRGRESIRNYDPNRPVDRAVLERILEAGRLAPSACNRQPWRFLVVSSPEALAGVRASYRSRWFQDAPHVLVVAGRRADAWTRADGYNSLETDLTIALDHLILAAEAEGVGTCWIAAFDPAALRRALPLAEDETVFALTPLGYPRADYVKKGTKDRKPLREVVEFL